MLVAVLGVGTSNGATAASGAPWSSSDYQPQPGNWKPYVLAPSGRDVQAVAVAGAVANAGSLANAQNALVRDGQAATLGYSGSDATASPRLTLDFGKEVGGRFVVRVTSTSPTPPKLYAAFSESELYMSADGKVGPYGDGESPRVFCSTCGPDYDAHVLPLTPVAPLGNEETVIDPSIRGGFRYVALFLGSAGTVSIDSVSLQFNASPQMSDPSAYQGWFLSSDNTLNKLWYAGAYTTQMDTIDSTTGNCPAYPAENPSRDADPVSVGTTVLVDGAKRDRLAWGYTGFEELSSFVTIQDYASPLNNILTRMGSQNPNGFIPGSTPWCTVTATANIPGVFLEIDAATTISIYNYLLYSGDLTTVQALYAKVEKAQSYLLGTIDSTGLVADNGFGCLHDIGYEECAHTSFGSALVYLGLRDAAKLAAAVGNNADGADWTTAADALGDAINHKLWDSARGGYLQSVESPGVISQEGTAQILWAGIATPAQAQRALAYLKVANWNAYGSAIWDRDGGKMRSGADLSAPWARHNDPEPTYFEVAARLAAHDDLDAKELIVRYWKHQISDDPRIPGHPPLTLWEREDVTGLPTLVNNFPAELTSLAHDWGVGPTVALTTQVLGVRPTAAGFGSFQVEPHPLGLSWLQGRVPTPHGPIDVAVNAPNHGAGFAMSVAVPEGTTASVEVPLLGAQRTVAVDGTVTAPSAVDAYYATFANVGPGKHQFTYAVSKTARTTCSTSYGGVGWPNGTTASATSTAAAETIPPNDTTTFQAAHAIDGNPASEWTGAGTDPASLTLKLGKAIPLNGIRLWLGPEGPPDSLQVFVDTGSGWQKAGQALFNSDALVNVPFATGVTPVRTIRVDLNGARPDAIGRPHVRIFEVQPLTAADAPLLLNTTLQFACTSAGTSPAQPAPTIPPGNNTPLYLHSQTSDVASQTASGPVLSMDGALPTDNGGGVIGSHWQIWQPATGTGVHFQWGTAAGSVDGLTIGGYTPEIYLLCSWPGFQPAGAATLAVDLYRVSQAGTWSLLGRDATPVPQLTLNQLVLLGNSVNVTSTTLAPGDRLVADVYLTGTWADQIYLPYDDISFPSGISLALSG